MICKPKAILSIIAASLLAIAIAPNTPSASADYYDPEAQMWYEFAHDKGIEINHILQNYGAAIGRKTYYAVHQIEYFCPDQCPEREMGIRYERIRNSIARRARLDVAKCVWEAQMKLEDCYTDARAQLEAAGYAYFLPYIYNPYRSVQGNLVEAQRYSNMHIAIAADCGSY